MICEHLQPPRYEDEAALHDYDATRRAIHRSAAAVRMVSRGFRGHMARTARVVRASDYRSWAEFAAQTHRHAELFETNGPFNGAAWVDDDVLRSLPKLMPRLRAVSLYHARVSSKGVEALRGPRGVGRLLRVLDVPR